MGSYCCTNQETVKGVDVPQGNLTRRFNELSMDQLALVIKVQARIRGFLCRKKINEFRIGSGIG